MIDMEEIIDDSIYEIDLHGLDMAKAKIVLDEVFMYVMSEESISELRIIVGVGKGSKEGPVLPSFVGNYLRDKGFAFIHTNGVLMIVL